MLLSSLLWVTVAFIYSGPSVAQKVTQVQPVTSGRQGETATLDCEYETQWSSDTLWWYKQLPSGEMVLLIWSTSGQTRKAGRYSFEFPKANSMSFIISGLQMEDSAKYFCAIRRGEIGLRGYMYTDKLFFGQGTRLTVEPRIQPPSKPSVFVMKNGTKVACLVKDFYPKNININLVSSNKVKEFEPAVVVSPSGKYSAVKLGQYEDPNSVTCSVQLNNETVSSTDFEVKTTSSDFRTQTEPANRNQPEKTCHEPKVYIPTMNMMSLTVLGLRMLFVKSVAINFVLTAKLFFF